MDIHVYMHIHVFTQQPKWLIMYILVQRYCSPSQFRLWISCGHFSPHTRQCSPSAPQCTLQTPSPSRCSSNAGNGEPGECVCVCIHIHVHTYTHIHKRSMNTHTHTHINLYIHVHVYTHTTYTHTHVRTLLKCTTYAHVRTHIHTHTYTHTHVQTLPKCTTLPTHNLLNTHPLHYDIIPCDICAHAHTDQPFLSEMVHVRLAL